MNKGDQIRERRMRRKKVENKDLGKTEQRRKERRK